MIKYMIKKDNLEEMIRYFDKTMEILDYNFGNFHPYNSKIYCKIARYYYSKNMFDDALLLYKSSLKCCERILGSSHLKVGEVSYEIA
jgi:DNA-binding SARP family transcriptional activator